MPEENTGLIAPATGLTIASAFNSQFNAEDFRVPRLNCIQKMSEIKGTPGELVLDRKSAIVRAGNKLPVTIVSIAKSWTEKVPFDSEYTPRVVRNFDEVADLKASSNYDIIPRADIVLLVPHDPVNTSIDDEEAAELFPFAIGENVYQLASLTVQSFAYDYTFKIVNSFHVGNPGVGLQDLVWNLSATLIERGKYSWYAPVLGRTTQKTPEDVLTFVNRLVNGGGQ